MHHSSLHIPTMRFLKTVKEIKVALKVRATLLENKQLKLRLEVENICKRWDLNAEEVYAAGSDEEAITVYSNKLGDNLGLESIPHRPMSVNQTVNQTVLKQLQADTARLPVLGRKHFARIGVLRDLERIGYNLGDDTRTFDLTYTELATLGF